MVLERGCNLLEIIPVGIGSGAILGSSSAVGNNCICMNFQLIQNLVSTSANIRNFLVKIQVEHRPNTKWLMHLLEND